MRDHILAFVMAQLASQNRPPTYREIAARFKFKSVRAVSYHIDRLVDSGSLRKLPGSRGLQPGKGEL